jgi:pimeloyl-ACP methyl ester carboxylesterase
VLYIHGFPLDRTLWRHQLATLTQYQRIALDLRGVGDSTAPADGYSMSRYADDIVAVLDALGLDRVIACGLSMGGYIIFDLLRRHSERLRAIVLCDTRAEADGPEARETRDEMARLALAQGTAAVGERLLPRVLSPTTQAEQPEVVDQYRSMVRRVTPEGMVGALRAMRDRPDSTPLLASIRIPTLVMVGTEDQASPPAVAEAMSRAIRGARLSVIPAAGHLSPLEQPLAASRALTDFLDSVTN